MRSKLKDLIAGSVGIFCVIYLLNPDAGVIELIPDNIPIIGNLDEAGAVLLLLRCLAHFGVDLSFLTGNRKPKDNAVPKPSSFRTAGSARAEVIDV